MARAQPLETQRKEDASTTSPASPTKTTNAATESVQRQTKRLTSTFPILLPPTQVHGENQTSFSSKYSSPVESARSSPQLAPQPTSPSDPNTFLTTLAAQERRVLELREELHKAEKDLAGLKKQWATFEANRKKSDVRRVEQLQSLSASHLSKTDSGGDVPVPLNLSSFEKLAAKPTRKPQQRVFSGSRHTRTLSLLTTTSGNSQKKYPEPLNSDVSAARPSLENKNSHTTLPRSSTMPGSEAIADFGKTYKNLANRRSMPPPPSTDALVKTGKQMASDLKEGLWTFFEDIRQATVGDEGINGPDTRNSAAVARQKSTPKGTLAKGAPRKRRSNTALEHSAQKAAYGDLKSFQDGSRTENGSEQSFWKEFGVDTPGRESRTSVKPPRRRQEAAQQQTEDLLVDVDDDWDAWESPGPHQKPSPERDTANASNDRDKSGIGTDALPWPELTRLTPSKLTRTVSNMMRDWESPHIGQPTSQSDGDGQVSTGLHA